MSRLISRICSRDSRYFSVISAMGMSKMSSLCSRMRWSSRSSGPSKLGSAHPEGVAAALELLRRPPARRGSRRWVGPRSRRPCSPVQRTRVRAETPTGAAAPASHQPERRPSRARSAPLLEDAVQLAGILLQLPRTGRARGRRWRGRTRAASSCSPRSPCHPPARRRRCRRTRASGSISLSSWYSGESGAWAPRPGWSPS